VEKQKYMKLAIDIIFIVFFLTLPASMLLAVANTHNDTYRKFFLKMMIISFIPFTASFFRFPIRYQWLGRFILRMIRYHPILFYVLCPILIAIIVRACIYLIFSYAELNR